ncbi:MAG: hypothetical protein M0R51_06355 [Clostridia bacterium]|jgi:hypothetical protein|nr:hypothetical protein [Clostridia bacterium]
MINKDSKLRISLKEINPYLISLGKYEAAEISVKNSFQYDKNGKCIEEVTILSEMKIAKEPEFRHPIRNIKLGFSFIEECLKRPLKPHKDASISEWNIYQKWNKMSNNDKLEFRIQQYAESLNCEIIKFDLI